MALHSNPSERYFKPLGVSENKECFIGECVDRTPISIFIDSKVYELWQEPAKKEKWASYIFKDTNGDVFMTTRFYRNDDEAQHDWPSCAIIRRTELEVEV